MKFTSREKLCIGVVVVACMVIAGDLGLHRYHQVRREQATTLIRSSNAGVQAKHVLLRKVDMNSNNSILYLAQDLNLITIKHPDRVTTDGNTLYLWVYPPFKETLSQQSYLARAAWKHDSKWFAHFSKANPARIVILRDNDKVLGYTDTKSSKMHLNIKPKYTKDVKYVSESDSQIDKAQAKHKAAKRRTELRDFMKDQDDMAQEEYKHKDISYNQYMCYLNLRTYYYNKLRKHMIYNELN